VAAALVCLAAPASAIVDASFDPEGSEHFGFFAAEGGDFVYLSGVGVSSQLFSGFGESVPVPVTTGQGGDAIADLDLGTDSRGRPVAVYSRCFRSGACGTYLYDFRARRERRMRFSRPGCTEYLPKVFRGTIVFGRSTRRSRRGSRRCPGGLFVSRPGKPPRRVTRGPYSDFDFAGATLAFVRSRPVFREGERRDYLAEVRLLRLGASRSRLVARARHSTLYRVDGFGGVVLNRVQLDDGYVYWKRSDAGSLDVTGAATRVDLVRVPVRGEAAQARLQREGRLYGSYEPLDFTVDGDRIYYSYFTRTGRAFARVEPRPPRFESARLPAAILAGEMTGTSTTRRR